MFCCYLVSLSLCHLSTKTFRGDENETGEERREKGSLLYLSHICSPSNSLTLLHLSNQISFTEKSSPWTHICRIRNIPGRENRFTIRKSGFQIEKSSNYVRKNLQTWRVCVCAFVCKKGDQNVKWMEVEVATGKKDWASEKNERQMVRERVRGCSCITLIWRNAPTCGEREEREEGKTGREREKLQQLLKEENTQQQCNTNKHTNSQQQQEEEEERKREHLLIYEKRNELWERVTGFLRSMKRSN